MGYGKSSDSQLRDFSISSLIGNTSDFKKNYKGTYQEEIQKETYDPTTGMFQTVAAIPQLESGTIQVLDSRLPTTLEQEKIDKFQSNILTANIDQLKRDQARYNSAISKIPESGIRDVDIQRLQNLGANLREVDGQIEIRPPTIGVGAFGAQRDISEFDFNRRPISAGSKVLTASLGETVGGLKQRQLQFFGVEKVKPLPIAQKVLGTDITITPEQYGSSVAKATEITADVGKYAIPYVGTALFAAEVGELGLDIAKTKKEVGYITTEQKREALITGAVLVTGGLLKGGQIILKNLPKAKYADLTKSKYKKLLQSIEGDKVLLEKGNVKWVSFERMTDGRVVLVGRQSSGGFSKEIKFVGKLDKTNPKRIVLRGEGDYTLEGTKFFSKGKKGQPKQFKFLETGKYEAASEGKVIPIEELGVNLRLPGGGKLNIKKDIGGEEWLSKLSEEEILKGILSKPSSGKYKQFGIGITEPTSSTFSVFQIKPRTFKQIKRLELKVGKQFKENVFFGGEITKDVAVKDVTKIKEGIYLTEAKGERGVSFIFKGEKPLKITKIEDKLPKLTIIKSKVKDVFRKTLPKNLRKKYDELSKIDKNFWKGQVAAGSKGRSSDVPIGQSKDKGYSQLFQIQAEVSEIIRTIPVPKSTPTLIVKSGDGLPYMVGGTGLKLETGTVGGLTMTGKTVQVETIGPLVVSPQRSYVGVEVKTTFAKPTGLVERNLFRTEFVGKTTTSFLEPKEIILQKQVQLLKQKQVQLLKQKQVGLLKPKQIGVMKQGQTQILKQKQVQLLKQKQVQLLKQKQVQVQRVGITQRLKPKEIIKTKRNIKPKLKEKETKGYWKARSCSSIC